MIVRTRKTTLKAIVLRVLASRLALLLGVFVVLAFGHPLVAGVSTGTAVITARQPPAPSWSTADAREHPECTPAADWPAGRLAPYLVVQAVRDGVHRKLSFDRAWRLNHNSTEVDDVWVLGVCG